MTHGETLRLDLWLWYARFYKTRSLATRNCGEQRIRVNGVPVRKASHLLRVGDVLTLPHRGDIRVVRILSLGTRRGPPAEAVDLYRDVAETAPGFEGIRPENSAPLLDISGGA